MGQRSRFHSRRKAYFRLLLFVFLLAIGLFAFLKVSMFMTDQNISDQQLVLDQQNQELSDYQNLEGHIKLAAIRELEQETNTMPWADRISKVIEMLNELKNITSNQSETIVLSDFKVNLESISLKGKVSSLLLLYYSNPQRNIISLIDRFEKLDFINNIHIQSYDRGDDSTFSFVLEANVSNDGTTE